MTVASLPTATPSTGTFTQYTYAALVLTFIGAPLSANNENNFVSWMQAENGTSTWTGTAGANNPLNNGLGSGGGSGLGSYPDLIVSAAYAAKGIEGGIQNAAQIGNALKADAPFSVFHAATVNSNWTGNNHYAGTGWAAATSPNAAGAVSAAQSEANGATKGVAVASSQTQAVLNTVGFNDILSSTSFWQNIQASLGQIGSATGVTGLVSWTESLGHILTDLTEPAWWLRVGMGALGLALFGVGLAGFISTTKPGQAAKGDLSSAAKDAATAALVA
jgi:hypothetical protein